jgi:hypothetical protein
MKSATGRDVPAQENSWGRAYGIAIGLFALEVALLYLFTLRFS